MGFNSGLKGLNTTGMQKSRLSCSTWS